MRAKTLMRAMLAKKRKTPEEREAERRYQEDLTRRLKEAIERYGRLAEERRASS